MHGDALLSALDAALAKANDARAETDKALTLPRDKRMREVSGFERANVTGAIASGTAHPCRQARLQGRNARAGRRALSHARI
jgi:hypothetical protein